MRMCSWWGVGAVVSRIQLLAGGDSLQRTVAGSSSIVIEFPSMHRLPVGINSIFFFNLGMTEVCAVLRVPGEVLRRCFVAQVGWAGVGPAVNV